MVLEVKTGGPVMTQTGTPEHKLQPTAKDVKIRPALGNHYD